MTDSGTDDTTFTWSVPECPFTVKCYPRVLDDIRLSVTDAFFSLPRGGAEIGGILLGKFDGGCLVIKDYAGLDCEHAYGPSFVLSPPDVARLTDLLSAQTNHPRGLRTVGWYHSHTRSEIFLSDSDLEIYNRFFPGSCQVALVLKPHTFEPARIGFFFRELDGSVRAKASYREDLLEAMPVRQMPAGVPTAASVNEPWARRSRPGPAAASVPAMVAAPAAAPLPPPGHPADLPLVETAAAQLPAPKFAVAAAFSLRRWIMVGTGMVATVGVLGAAYQVRQMWLPHVLAAVGQAPPSTPPHPALGLNSIDREGQLQIGWDCNSPAVRRASEARLEITDGGTLPVIIQLDAAHLAAGSFTYARNAGNVDIKLILPQQHGPDFREVTSFLGKPPERKSDAQLEAERLQREEMARQSAKMKFEMNSQAAKTKRLEQEVESMREELRQQQQHRLNNQVPDK